MKGLHWEIIDSEGTLYSGPEEAMRAIFEAIMKNDPEFKDVVWSGILKLVEIHDMYGRRKEGK